MSERTEVQDPLIRHATEIGWTYIAPKDSFTLHGRTKQVEMNM